MVELHCHTTFSDGTLTPAELVAAAIAAGVQALAITDHDTCAGWDAAIAAAGDRLEIVPGLELSVVHNGRSLHILGFYPDRDRIDGPLSLRLEGRRQRAQRMADKLAELGYPIDLPQLPGNMAPGRPHVARALLAAGHVTSAQEAFTRFLGDDRPAHVQYDKFSIQEGLTLLRDAGAIPVWAHPYLFRGGNVEDTLHELVAAGLMGVEVYHPNHSLTEQKRLLDLCDRYKLLVTGGSDYHGPNPGTKAERRDSLNQFQLPLTLLDRLKAAKAGACHQIA
ncbi:MAG: PHP domain-containing protein [Oscillatoriales cyanobacterium]|nr:MAG: PHP domain-containing protein [Oscillatoriales cyanobacterium]